MKSYLFKFYLYEQVPDVGSNNILVSTMIVSTISYEYAQALGDGIASSMNHPEEGQNHYWCSVEEVDWGLPPVVPQQVNEVRP